MTYHRDVPRHSCFKFFTFLFPLFRFSSSLLRLCSNSFLPSFLLASDLEFLNYYVCLDSFFSLLTSCLNFLPLAFDLEFLIYRACVWISFPLAFVRVTALSSLAFQQLAPCLCFFLFFITLLSFFPFELLLSFSPLSLHWFPLPSSIYLSLLLVHFPLPFQYFSSLLIFSSSKVKKK